MTGQTSIEIQEKITSENIAENCKNNVKNIKNDTKIHQTSEKCVKKQEDCISLKTVEKTKISAYVKALFTVYPSLPNIIKVVDNIVMQRASSIVPLSSVYGGVSSTMKEIEKVIDMSDRKMRILDIVSVTREILSGLSEKDYEIIDMKFFKRMKTSSMAGRLEIDERSVFRRVGKAIERCVKKCIENGYDSKFFCDEIDGEAWIKEIYNKAMSEISANKLRGKRNF